MMQATHALRLLGLAGLCTLLAAPALAQDDSYPYAGASIGQSRARIDEERITAGLLAQGLTTTAFSRDESNVGYKLFGGWQLNRYVALEGGYFNLGKFGFQSTTAPAGTLNGKIKLQGLNLDLVGTLPFTERWFAIGRVGVQYAQARDSFSSTGAILVANPSPSARKANYKFGAGLQYELSRSFLIRAEGERYRIDDAVGNRGDINLFSVSLVIPFGRAPEAAAPRPVAVAPAYVAPAPEPASPAPIVVAAAPVAVVAAPVAVVAPVARPRVSFSADSLFAFDKSVVRPEGKTALDHFAKELAGTQFDVITVAGHTDRIGSDPYNQRLSTQRAEAVKSYLVQSGGIAAAKISAVGRSESDPVTKRDDCHGSKPTPKLIDCLQPDRRVDVEVAGTR